MLAAEPARQHRLWNQHLEQAGEQEAQRQLEPDATQQLNAGGEAAPRQRRVAGKRNGGRHDDERQEDPETRVHAPALHTPSAARAVR